MLVGAIYHFGDATIQNCEFTDNSGNFGGAIANPSASTLTIKNSTFVRNNGQSGGAIWNGGSLAINGSEFYDNTATISGGAIFNCMGSLLMKNSVVMRNSARESGGGIWATPPPELKHTTVSDNAPDDIAANASSRFCRP